MFPVFGLMALGFVAAKLKALDASGVRGLVLFVFNFAIPALLLRSLARMDLPPDIEWGFLIAFYAGAFATYGLGMAAGKALFGCALPDQATFGMAASFSNLILLGVPIVLTALGPDAALPMFLIIGFHSSTLMPLTVGLIRGGRGSGESIGRQIASVFLEMLKNPIILGIFFGIAVNLGGITLWSGIDRILEFLGAAAVPCALFAMGASLASYPLKGDVRPAVLLTVLKLVVHPALVWVVAVPILGLEGLWVSVAVIMAGMPSGVNVYLFASRYETRPGVAARTVLLTSMCSVVTIWVLLLLMGS